MLKKEKSKTDFSFFIFDQFLQCYLIICLLGHGVTLSFYIFITYISEYHCALILIYESYNSNDKHCDHRNKK